MGESPHVTPAFVDADALVAFLESLRAAGYRIGTEKYIAAHDVALALSAEPRDRRTAERLGSLLRPLLCSTASEQEEFAGRFRQWADRIVPDQHQAASPAPFAEPDAITPARREAPLAESLAAMKRKSAGFWRVTAILCAVIAYAIWDGTTTESLATVHIQSDPEGAIVRVIEGDEEPSADVAGDSVGRTGMQWDSVAPKRYTLHFHLARYHDVIHVLDVAGDTVHHVNVTLSPTPRSSLSLTSDPPGATVRLEPVTREHGSELIDTVRTGMAPIEWSDISVGEYRVTLLLDDYEPVSQSIMID
jgi:hypothetical protein